MEKLSKEQIIYLDELFNDYQHVDHDIDMTKFELLTSQKKTVQNRLNRHLLYLQQLNKDCTNAINRFDQYQFKLYCLRYTKYNYYTWHDIATIVGYSRAQIYRQRYALLYILAEERGLV